MQILFCQKHKLSGMRIAGSLMIAACVGAVSAAHAQDVAEAFNLSNLTVQGTARSMGFGNALGSVGGDFSSVSVNPAGLGIYRSSELMFTPSLRINGSKSDYLGNSTTDNNTRFNINNFGLVLTGARKGRRYDRSDWKSVSFAMGMNRVADFNHDYHYSGRNITSSGSQVFESDANAYPNDVTTNAGALGYMGYQSYLLDPYGTNTYKSIVPFTGGVDQLKSVRTRGGISEFTGSLAGNYKEKLMLGATVGVSGVNYSSTSYYQETLSAGNQAANPRGFDYFQYNQQLNVTGVGVNLKLGAIYKISDVVRVGAAFHSPTLYSLSETYTPSLTVAHNDSVATLTVGNGSITGSQYDYNLTTPWKGVLSATFVLKGIGFVTADYEYVSYNSMRYMYSGGFDNYNGVSYQYEQDQMNNTIQDTYKGASNFRIGAEGLINKYLMARAGFGYYGNAYKSSDYNSQRIDVSLGLGVHFDYFFADLVVVHSAYQNKEQPYNVNFANVVSGPAVTIPTATTNMNLNNVAMTVGFKF